MALYIDLYINAALIEGYEVARTTNLGRPKLEPDEVSEYEVSNKFGELQGTVTHRYGDGAATLARKALQLLEGNRGPEDS